jgi:hypothetical protein
MALTSTANVVKHFASRQGHSNEKATSVVHLNCQGQLKAYFFLPLVKKKIFNRPSAKLLCYFAFPKSNIYK